MLSKSKILLFLVLFLCFSCRQENNFDKQPKEDRAYTLFEKGKKADDISQKLSFYRLASKEAKVSDTILPYILDHQIYYSEYLKEYDSAFFFANKMRDLALKNKDTLLIAQSYYRKARTFLAKKDYENVLENMYKAQQYYLLGGDSIKAGKRLVEVAIAQERLGDLAGSQQSNTRALELLKHTKDSAFLVSLYNSLAITYRRLGDRKEALKEFQNALDHSTASEEKVTILNNMALIHADLKEYEKALKIWQEISKIPTKDSINWARAKENHLFYKWLSNGTREIDSLKIIAEKREAWKDYSGLLASYAHLTSIYTREKSPLAKIYAEKLLETSKSIKSEDDILLALDHLVDLSEGNSSKSYAQDYIKLSDSLKKARINAKNLFAKIRYDEEQKLVEIDHLQELSAKQQIDLLQQKNQKLVAIFAILLLLFLGVIIYIFLQQKHKREKLNERYKTEKQLAKKVHDELANDIYQIMAQLQEEKHAKILDQLENVYRRTRDISRENAAIKTNQNFKEDLFYMISKTSGNHIKLITNGFENISWNQIEETKKITIYRVLQELLVNSRKHSKASSLILSFANQKKFIEINYRDNGIGFDKSGLKKMSGLANTENRIKDVNGSFTFETEPNAGFSARIKIPN
ncbi:tetratricopeptide repeat-containing sensor histidine kinase [Zunongwangia atlantica]|uniref:histidine kinase n=1 Tax=Zunongwangia atlantica 22II14-10F7 TaxID=1185767 RepID=A0A1Y1T9G9_9FLAO|nr:tetratricopeptide repeat-containing sensor histidine kinase [Zunongwangia atlantica]ORL47043.1 two-component system sensor histidine kinase [Zunongwangia atlantica 22II14-10F7]